MVSTCPHCGKQLKTDEALAGKVVICPACKQHFTVANHKPQAGKTQPADSQSPASQALPRKSSRKPLFMGLAFCGVCALLVAGIVGLYPRSEGPLTVYVVPHVDDIDGAVNQDWFFFYDQLRKWHDRNAIPACFAFYPGTMGDSEFNRIIAEMYASKNIELVLKGEDEYQGKRLDTMSSVEVQRVLQTWNSKFVSRLEQLGYSNIQSPVTYNQLMMRLTEAIRDAASKVQFRTVLELGGSEHGYIEMLPDLDITQYSVSLTRSGEAGPAEEFKTVEEVIQELLDFQNDRLIYINGVKVIPLLCNQRDFRRSEESSAVDEGKWKTYTSLLRRAKADSRICLLTAREVYDLRHRALAAP